MGGSSKTAEAERLERVTITLPTSLAERIKTYWHEQRLGSNSEAARALIEAGLEAERKKGREAAKR